VNEREADRKLLNKDTQRYKQTKRDTDRGSRQREKIKWQ